VSGTLIFFAFPTSLYWPHTRHFSILLEARLPTADMTFERTVRLRSKLVLRHFQQWSSPCWSTRTSLMTRQSHLNAFHWRQPRTEMLARFTSRRKAVACGRQWTRVGYRPSGDPLDNHRAVLARQPAALAVPTYLEALGRRDDPKLRLMNGPGTAALLARSAVLGLCQ
jgi:hypothetical protein